MHDVESDSLEAVRKRRCMGKVEIRFTERQQQQEETTRPSENSKIDSAEYSLEAVYDDATQEPPADVSHRQRKGVLPRKPADEGLSKQHGGVHLREKHAEEIRVEIERAACRRLIDD